MVVKKIVNGWSKWIALGGLIITLVGGGSGILWALATQNSRLESVYTQVMTLTPTVHNHESVDARQDKEIAILQTKQTAIYEGVKRIEQKIDALP